jgi:hypothetical protein
MGSFLVYSGSVKTVRTIVVGYFRINHLARLAAKAESRSTGADQKAGGLPDLQQLAF